MSLSNILNPPGGVKSSNNFEVNNLLVDGTTTLSGPIITSGNITVLNPSPKITIQNSAINSNNATLQLQGASNISPVTIDQNNLGNLRIINNATDGGIRLTPNGLGSFDVLKATNQIRLGASTFTTINAPDPAAGRIVTIPDIGANSNVALALSGSWTPQLLFGGTPQAGYFLNVGVYNRIGNVVFIEFSLFLNNPPVGVGSATISGLPFVAGGSTTINSMEIQNNSNVTVTGNLIGGILPASSIITLIDSQNGAGSNTFPDDTKFNNLSSMIASGFYFV